MANGAGRIFNVMKHTSEETNTRPSLVVFLTVKSINPLVLERDDRLEIIEEFCVFSKTVNKSTIAVGDKLTAFTFNEGQVYFIQQNEDKPIDISSTVDSALSSTSVNPVQNKVVTTKLQNMIEKTITVSNPTTRDLNDYKTDGRYYFYAAPTNIPAGINGFLDVFTADNGTVKQIWYRHGTPDVNDYETYTRIYSSNIWSSWKRFQTNKIETGNITYNTAYIVGTPDQYHYCRNGNVVQISFRAQLVNSIPNDTTIITLPYNHPIRTEVDAYKGTRYTRDNTHFAYVPSNTNQIRITTWSETNKYIHITHTYITDAN